MLPAGGLSKMQFDQMVNSPGWMTLPDFARKEVIENTLRESRASAEGLIQMRYPELIQQAYEARAKQIAAH